MDRVVFHQAEPSADTGKWWITDATRQSNGDIRICSGDSKREWHTVITAANVDHLKSALLHHLPDKQDNHAADVLSLMVQKFTVRDGDGNAYNAIQSFLHAEEIPFQEIVW